MTETTVELKPGDKMPDGTVYAGMSPDTGKPMYTTPADAPLTYTFNKARKYAAKLDSYDHKDWRLPTEAELIVLWQNLNKGALKGTFNVQSPQPYLSSLQNGPLLVGARHFCNGIENWESRFAAFSLRCVRT